MAPIDEPLPFALTAPAQARARSRSADKPPSWLGEIVGGGVASVATLAIVLTLGLLGYAPLGNDIAVAGIAAAFVTVTLGGLVFALLGNSAMPVGGPSSATALIYAALIASLVTDPSLSLARPGDVFAIVCAASAAVIVTGLLQVLFALLGLGKLAKFVPQPVLAGFMNGVALLILFSQVPALLGATPSTNAGLSALLAQTQPLALLLGLSTAATIWLVGWRWPRAQAPLVGLVAGLLLYAGLRAMSAGASLGPVVGPLPKTLPMAGLADGLQAPHVTEFIVRHAPEVLTSALVLALISSLESVLGALAVDRQLNSRHHAGRELLALGVANVVVGLFGGLPMVMLRARALATLKAGGRGPRAALAGSIVYALLYGLFGSALALLPKAVLAGIMVTIAVGLADRWTHQLIVQLRAGERASEAWRSLAIIAAVCVITVWHGFVYGVAAGIVASLAVFIHAMNRSLIRARGSAVAAPSKRLYPQPQEAILREARRHVLILELEGAVFFGSADRLADEADALPEETRFLVLDFRRVTTIDESGAVLLQQLSERLMRRHIPLLMAGVMPDNVHGQRLRAFGCFREAVRDDWFPDVDRAVEAAEQRLLGEHEARHDDETLPLAACSLFRGLSDEGIAFVREHLVRRNLAAGSALFVENDPADRLFVLTRGSLTIVAGAGPEHTRQRFASFSPGVMLGETGMLDRGTRSASAAADASAEVFELTQASLDAIVAQRPELGAQLFRNIAVHLSERLRSATAQRGLDRN